MGANSYGIYQKGELNKPFGEQTIFEQSATPNYALGAARRLADGRMFRYAKAGASALVPAYLCQTAAPTANHLNMTCAAAAAGATQVTVTDGGTAFTANQYAEGFLHINDVDGEGYIYKIKSHPANAGSTTCVFTLYDPIIVALTANSQATATKMKYDSIVVCPTTLTGSPVGIPIIDVTANYYFWLQVKGPCPGRTLGTLVVGNHCVPANDTTAGALEPASDDILPVIGFVMQVNATTEESLIDLRLD